MAETHQLLCTQYQDLLLNCCPTTKRSMLLEMLRAADWNDCDRYAKLAEDGKNINPLVSFLHF